MKRGKRMEKTKKIWLNGEIVNWGEARVHVTSRTLNYGIGGVFEGLRYYNTDKGPAIFRLSEHIKRLFDSAKIEDLEIPFSYFEIRRACMDIARLNNLKQGYIRPLVFVDDEDKMGLGPIGDVKVSIATWGWDSYLGEESLAKGIKLKTSSYTKDNRTPERALMWKAKAVGNYSLLHRAKKQALKQGNDEALLLSEDGFVAECSAENIFFVKNGMLITPPQSAPILLGITRDSIIKIAQNKGYGVIEWDIVKKQLYAADEIFLTGTAAEVTPVREIDNRKVGDGKPGLITLELQKIYFDIVHGKMEKYKRWLTYI